MGLAASQGRYLLLGVRKNDVEGRLMSIANQKLSLARQSSNLSEAYSNALNSTTKSLNTSVSYSQFMNVGSVDSSGYQYVFTDANNGGKVILSSALATKFGLPGSSGNLSCLPTDTPTMAGKLATATGFPLAGVQAYLTAQGTDGAATSNAVDFPAFGQGLAGLEEIITNAGLLDEYKNHTVVNLGTNADTLDGEQVNSFGSFGAFDKNIVVNTNLQATLVSMCNDLATPLALAMNVSVDDIRPFLSLARNATLLQFTGGKGANFGENNINKLGDYCDDSYAKNAQNWNKLTFSVKENGKGSFFIDMSEAIKTFLNYFQIAWGMRNCDDNYKIETAQQLYNACNINQGTKVGGQDLYALGACFRNKTYYDSFASTNTVLQNFGGSSAGPTDPSGLNSTQISLLNWYLNLYNAINSNGWTLNSNATTSATALQNGILNGSINLMQIGSGGLLANASDDLINEEEDEEAIEKAQAEYEAGKDKLDYKESMLDLQQHNLDTELSAVNTEIDSVKKIIDNNIKIFKMFDA